MTTLVSLLIVAMIPIDCKITIFSLHLFVNFFGTIIYWWIYKHYFKRKNNHEYFFAGTTPIDQLKLHMPVSIIFTYALPVTQCYRKRVAQKVSPYHYMIIQKIHMWQQAPLQLMSQCLVEEKNKNKLFGAK